MQDSTDASVKETVIFTSDTSGSWQVNTAITKVSEKL